MSTNISGSAKIYTFPPRGRFALRLRDDSVPAAPLPLVPGSRLAVGGAWYHDEAIREASERDRKN